MTGMQYSVSVYDTFKDIIKFIYVAKNFTL